MPALATDHAGYKYMNSYVNKVTYSTKSEENYHTCFTIPQFNVSALKSLVFWFTINIVLFSITKQQVESLNPFLM